MNLNGWPETDSMSRDSGPNKSYFHDHKHEFQQEAAAVAVGREAEVVVSILLTIGAFQHPDTELIRNPVKSPDWQHQLHWQSWLH